MISFAMLFAGLSFRWWIPFASVACLILGGNLVYATYRYKQDEGFLKHTFWGDPRSSVEISSDSSQLDSGEPRRLVALRPLLPKHSSPSLQESDGLELAKLRRRLELDQRRRPG